jgi:hypothetical protein
MNLFFIILSLHFPEARATESLDVLFKLESVGCMQPVDNVDGLFAALFQDACRDYFHRETRFQYRDITPFLAPMRQSKIPYAKWVQDKKVLATLSAKSDTESLVRSALIRKGMHFELHLEWLHVPQLEVLATLSAKLSEVDEFGAKLSKESLELEFLNALDALVRRVPYLTQITGRKDHGITLALAPQDAIQPGSKVFFGTLSAVRVHPLLKTVTAWEWEPTGEGMVDAIEERMAFVTLVSEQTSGAVKPFQRVVQVLAPPPLPPALTPETRLIEAVEQKPIEPKPLPPLGKIQVGPSTFLGVRNFEEGETITKGGGIGGGYHIHADTLIKENWFLGFDLEHFFWDYTQVGRGTGIDAGPLAVSNLNVHLRTGYLVPLLAQGPKTIFEVGFHQESLLAGTFKNERFGALFVSSLSLGFQVNFKWGPSFEGGVQFGYRPLVFPSAAWLDRTPTRIQSLDLGLRFGYELTTRTQLGLQALITPLFMSIPGAMTQEWHQISVAPTFSYHF